MGGSVRVIAWLLRHGCRFDAVQKEGQSPLHKAAAKKNFDALAAIASALLLPLTTASCDGGASGEGETDLLLDRIRAAIGGFAGAVDDGALPLVLELARPAVSPAESVIGDMRQLFALRDTSGMTARDIALAQGMHADHAAFAILSVFDS